MPQSAKCTLREALKYALEADGELIFVESRVAFNIVEGPYERDLRSEIIAREHSGQK